jgi:hypothetical protein
MRRWFTAGLRAILGGSVAAAAFGGCSCNRDFEDWDRCGEGGAGGAANGLWEGPPMITNKLDLLLVLDNSGSMLDKQQILALAVPDLVKSLVSPPCIDPATGELDDSTGPLDPCPQGLSRRFHPVLDIHVGILSSSLGGHGSDACPSSNPGTHSRDDRGHLLARSDPQLPGVVETYQDLDFLAWDPTQKLDPPGEADLSADTAVDANGTALLPQLRDIVMGVGQLGCGYESQLEAWYRFLVDPTPYDEIGLDEDGKVVVKGIDEVLLAQRRAFLRPSSALAVVVLSDENDCSIRENGQFYLAAQQQAPNGAPFHLPASRAICETDPGDPCCFSCGQTGPKDCLGEDLCPPDPTCKRSDGKTVYLDLVSDSINLRCFEQKRRFGIDFLYPIDRYVDALSRDVVTDRHGEVVPNPLFSILDPEDEGKTVRDPGLVLLAGIVGVPWQDIARPNGGGLPDLEHGIGPDGSVIGGFKTSDELSQVVPGTGLTAWDVILGDFEHGGRAADPLMHESIAPRTGTGPITGFPMVTSANPLANHANGHEYAIPQWDDLQYACIFPLVKIGEDGTISPDVRDCAASGIEHCDCDYPHNDSPLCQVNPETGDSTDQVYAKAYPGLREIALLQRLGPRGVVASVCPAQLVDPAGSDFGYRPAVAALVERLKPHFE